MKGLYGVVRATGCMLALALLPLAASSAYGEAAVSVSVTQGGDWISTAKMGIMTVKKAPQYAAWIETADGKYVQTLMVTSRSANGKWRAAPAKGRPEALPVWFAAKASGATKDDIDAATSATPEAGAAVTAKAGGLIPGMEYVVRFEINHSFDYNAAWPKNAKEGEAGFSGVNGQPSLVYEARFVAGKQAIIPLRPLGHGAVDGSSGALIAGTDGMTSALTIVGSVIVTVKGE